MRITTFLFLSVLVVSCGKKSTLVSDPAPEITYDDPVGLRLEWTRPKFRENCSELKQDEIGGYKVLFGMNKGVYGPALDIQDNSVEAYDFMIDADGRYHLNLNVYDTDDLHSRNTGEVVVECLNSSCAIVLREPTTPDINCNGERAESFSLKVLSEDRPVRERRVGKEVCPAFPLRNPKVSKLDFYSKNLKVTLPLSSEIIQCNFRRSRSPENVEKHLVGYKRVNLHLPIFTNGRAVRNDNSIILPYDLTVMTKEDKQELAVKIGGTRKINYKNAFNEIPYMYWSNGGFNGEMTFNDKEVARTFALIDSKYYAAVSSVKVNICKKEERKNCVHLRDIVNGDVERSKFLERNIKNNRLPVLRLDFSPELDVNTVLEDLNSSDLKNLSIYHHARVDEDRFRYVNFSLVRDDNHLRPHYLKVDMAVRDELALVNKILKLDHPHKNVQALTFLDSVLSDRKITPEMIREKSPAIIDVAKVIWAQEENAINSSRWSAFKLLKLMKEDLQVERLDSILEFITPFYYSTEQGLEKAVEISKFDDSIVSAIKTALSSGAKHYPPHFYVEAVVQVMADLTLSLEQKVRVVKVLEDSFSILTSYGYDEYDVDVNSTTKRVIRYVKDYAATDEELDALRKMIVALKEMSVVGFDWYVDFFAWKEKLEYILNTSEQTILVKKLDTQSNLLYLEILRFLYSREGVYMFKFEDAVAKTEFYLYDAKMNSSVYSNLKNAFGYWTSRGQTFFKDGPFVLEYVEKAYTGTEAQKKKYLRLEPFYGALVNSRLYNVSKKRDAFDLAVSLIDDSTTDEVYNLKINILNWFSRNFSEFISTKMKVNRMSEYLRTYRVDAEKFQKLVTKYNDLVGTGRSPKNALNAAERIILGKNAIEEEPVIE